MTNVFPVTRKIDAIFYCRRRKEIVKRPVLLIAPSDPNLNNKAAYYLSDNGYLALASDHFEFLGFETDGKERDWTEEIKELMNRPSSKRGEF